MIYNYPFFYFPHYNKYNSNYLNTRANNYTKPLSSSFYVNNCSKHNFKNVNSGSNYNVEHQPNPNTQKYDNFNYKNHSNNILSNLFNQNDRNKDEKCFEIFGIKLYYDDILLICLIFFLYKEDVKDSYLFIALILLLLS